MLGGALRCRGDDIVVDGDGGVVAMLTESFGFGGVCCCGCCCCCLAWALGREGAALDATGWRVRV